MPQSEGAGILRSGQGSGEKRLREECTGRDRTWGNPTSSPSLPHTRYYADSPGMRLEPQTCDRSRTASPQASPMAELSAPSKEPAARGGEPRVRGCQAGSVGITWLPLGLGPWGSPFGPRFAGRKGNRLCFGESIRKKVIRVEGRLPL